MGQHFTKDADIERMLKPYHSARDTLDKQYGQGTLLKKKTIQGEVLHFMKVLTFKNKREFLAAHGLFKERLGLISDNIVQLKEVHMKVEEKVFETSYNLFLILEYCRGNLEQYQAHLIKEKKKNQQPLGDNEVPREVNAFEAVYILDCLANGTYYLHQKGLNRGDIQPANIMITNTKNYKLMDHTLFSPPHSVQTLSQGRSLMRYLAPEQLPMVTVGKRNKRNQESGEWIIDSEKAAVFQLGVIMLQVLLNESQANMYDYKFKVIKWDLLTIQVNQVKTAYGESLAKLLEDMLAETPANRPTLQKIIKRIENLISSNQKCVYQEYCRKRKDGSDTTVGKTIQLEAEQHSSNESMDDDVPMNYLAQLDNSDQSHRSIRQSFQQQPVLSGRVKEEYKNGSSYEGEKRNGQRHGRGRFTYEDGAYYEGQWVDNKIQGRGILYFKNYKVAYSGDWVQDKFQGFGTLFNEHPNGDTLDNKIYMDFNRVGTSWEKYEGDFHQDHKDGFGIWYLVGGMKFSGKFKEDKVHGKGTFYRTDGSMLSGNWQEGKFI